MNTLKVLSLSSLIALTSTVIVPTSAWASSLVSSTATNIEVDGELYDFTFFYEDTGQTVFNDYPSLLADIAFPTSGEAKNAVQAILAQVPSSIYDPLLAPSIARGFYIVSSDSFFFGNDSSGNANENASLTLTASNNFTLAVASPVSQPEAIPTPALLPGILGMGLATLRKRKQT